MRLRVTLLLGSLAVAACSDRPHYLPIDASVDAAVDGSTDDGDAAAIDAAVDGAIDAAVFDASIDASVPPSLIVPDFNGDGYADVIVGAAGNDAGGSGAGRVYIYFGAPGGTINTTADGILTGAAASDGFGDSVASAGDVNGDGYTDVIVGAPGSASSAGRAYIYLGGPGASFDTTADSVIASVAGDVLGKSVASAGDVNGDGYADVVVGAIGNDAGGLNAGRAYVYFGGSGGTFDPVADGTLTGAAGGDAFGIVSSAGDVNGDTYDDIIVGAVSNDAGGTNAGSAYVYLGGAGATFNSTADGTLVGAGTATQLGKSVASAGDVNMDGYADVVVGAPTTGAGSAYVYLGGAGATFNSTADGTLTGAATGDQFGFSVAPAGDVNGDGYADIVVGANTAGAEGAGRAYVYLGGPGGTFNATADGTLVGAIAGDGFGVSVSSAGDVNSDDYDDVVVGALNNDAGGTDAGRAYLYLGGEGITFNAAVDGTLTGAAAGDRFGQSVN